MSPLSKAAKATFEKNPDARPTVAIHDATKPNGNLAFQAVCTTGTGTCTWTYGPALKTDAQQHATWHRNDHRRRAAETGTGERQ